MIGYDCSRYNVESYKYAKNNGEFIILKATQGIDYCDKTFISRLSECSQRGKNLGYYHFWENKSGNLQFLNMRDYIVNHIKASKGHNKGILKDLVVIDVEISFQDININELKIMIKRLEDLTSGNICIYTNYSYYKKLVKKLPNCMFWVARWNSKLTIKDFENLERVILWQKGIKNIENKQIFYKDIGAIKGVDINETVGDYLPNLWKGKK